MFLKLCRGTVVCYVYDDGEISDTENSRWRTWTHSWTLPRCLIIETGYLIRTTPPGGARLWIYLLLHTHNCQLLIHQKIAYINVQRTHELFTMRCWERTRKHKLPWTVNTLVSHQLHPLCIHRHHERSYCERGLAWWWLTERTLFHMPPALTRSGFKIGIWSLCLGWHPGRLCIIATSMMYG